MRCKKNGMTLVEVIIAIALLGIITVSFMMMYTNSYAYIYSAGRKTNAVAAAEKSLESSVASGTASTGNTLAVNFGGTSISLTGEMVTKTETYDNGSKTVVVSSFVPINSVASGKPDTAIEAKLEVYANEKTLRVSETFLIETNKAATFSVEDSNADVATVNSTTGLVEAKMLGTEVIKVVPISATYPGDFQLVTIIVSNQKKLMDVKGGQYVFFEGVKYQKLTGLNGRVLELVITGGTLDWSSSLQAPSREELSGDNWTTANRYISNEYWTITPETKNNPQTGQFVNSSGNFADAKNNDKYYLRKAVTLDQHLKVSSGSGDSANPYVLVNE